MKPNEKVNKSQLAKRLGVSRPTVYKMISKMSKKDAQRVSNDSFICTALSNLPATSPQSIEQFLEWLEDNHCLSDEGKRLRLLIWERFIKE